MFELVTSTKIIFDINLLFNFRICDQQIKEDPVNILL